MSKENADYEILYGELEIKYDELSLTYEEFKETSKMYEKELEDEVEYLNKQVDSLSKKNEKLTLEKDTMKSKNDQNMKEVEAELEKVKKENKNLELINKKVTRRITEMEIENDEFENSKRISDITICELEDQANNIMEKLAILQTESETVKELDQSLIDDQRINQRDTESEQERLREKNSDIQNRFVPKEDDKKLVKYHRKTKSGVRNFQLENKENIKNQVNDSSKKEKRKNNGYMTDVLGQNSDLNMFSNQKNVEASSKKQIDRSNILIDLDKSICNNMNTDKMGDMLKNKEKAEKGRTKFLKRYITDSTKNVLSLMNSMSMNKLSTEKINQSQYNEPGTPIKRSDSQAGLDTNIFAENILEKSYHMEEVNLSEINSNAFSKSESISYTDNTKSINMSKDYGFRDTRKPNKNYIQIKETQKNLEKATKKQKKLGTHASQSYLINGILKNETFVSLNKSNISSSHSSKSFGIKEQTDTSIAKSNISIASKKSDLIKTVTNSQKNGKRNIVKMVGIQDMIAAIDNKIGSLKTTCTIIPKK